MKSSLLRISGLAFALGCLTAHAAVITVFYGDNDGFGVGQTSGNLTAPTVGHAGGGEAAGTDVRLIGTGGYDGPAFAPTGSFAPFSVAGQTITSATLTLRTGSLANYLSLDGQNVIFLGGLQVPNSFINGFSAAYGNQIETRSIVLDSSFFSVLGTGNVSLLGTHISEGDGAGSFQIDFLQLDIVTTTGGATPDGGVSVAMLGLAVLSLAALRRRVA